MPNPLLDERVIKASDVIGGKYRVERILGAGGMGIVVATQHVDLPTRFALKIMRPEAAKDPESVERFVREARAAVQLKSEHCVRVMDVGKMEDGSPYMVMEFLVGSDLGALIERDGARSPAEAADFILQACEGLAEAHARGIVHRDIKPPNLFVTRRADGTALVKVLDFGLAKSLHATKEMRVLTQTTAVMGSPVYMSPEQMRASREVDARSDLWSLGVCLHELLTGRPPFDGATFPELCSMVLKEPPTPLPSDIPRGLSRIVARCLEKKAERRYRSVGELADALEEFVPVRGAAGRIRAVLAAPRDAMASVHPRHVDPNAETRSGATMDTVKRPKPGGRPRWATIAYALAIGIALVAGGIVVSRAAPRSRAPETTAARTTVNAPVMPVPSGNDLPSAPIDTTTASPPAPAPAGDAIISTQALTPAQTDSAKRPHAPRAASSARHSSAPPTTAPASPATPPVLKPKTTEF